MKFNYRPMCACSRNTALRSLLLFSCIAVLYYFHAVSTSTFHILNWIGGIIAYGAGGALFAGVLA